MEPTEKKLDLMGFLVNSRFALSNALSFPLADKVLFALKGWVYKLMQPITSELKHTILSFFVKLLDVAQVVKFFSKVTKNDISSGANLLTSVEIVVSWVVGEDL